MRIVRLAALVLTVAPVLAAPAATGSSVPPSAASFSIRPVTYEPARPETQSYFIFDARPGETIRTQLRITNVGAQPGTALLYPVDATTGETSGTVYRSHSVLRRDVGAWVRLPVSRIRLEPGEDRVLTFYVLVSKNARSGDHVGGIVAENVSDQSKPRAGSKGGSSIQIKLRLLSIIAVEVQVPGPRVARVAVTDVEADRISGYQRFRIGLENKGNVLVKPTMLLRIRNAAGRLVLGRRISLDTLLPHTEIAYPTYIRGKGLPPGRYQASVTLSYPPGRVVRHRSSFDVTKQG